jgi:hypothetical protein
MCQLGGGGHTAAAMHPTRNTYTVVVKTKVSHAQVLQPHSTQQQRRTVKLLVKVTPKPSASGNTNPGLTAQPYHMSQL